MTPLDLASLVVIAAQTLGEDTQSVLGRLDVTAAQTALAEAMPSTGTDDPAAGAVGLLSALIRHPPLTHGNEPVAVAAMTTLLALNGWQADLEPAERCADRITSLIVGEVTETDFAAWLSKRIFQPGSAPATDTPASDTLAHESPAKEEHMHRWRPGRRRPGRKKGTFQRFTPAARQVVVLSQEEARSLNHDYVGTEHVLLGLLQEGNGLAARALDALGISREAVRQEILGIIGMGKQPASVHIPFTPRAKKVLELSLREAFNLGHLYIGTEHILLGLTREGSGLAAQVLVKLGADLNRVREQVLQLPYSPPVTPRGPVPAPGIRDFDLLIAQTRHEKDAAIDAGDFEQAAVLRGREKELQAERDRRIAEWSSATDMAELGRELDRLRVEVSRLQDLLLQHGIEPNENGQQTA